MPEPLLAPEASHETVARLRRVLDEVIGPLLDGGPVALLDHPDHANVGDSAIWLGETAFLRARGIPIRYVSTIGSHDHGALASALPEGSILLHGGGNFGTLWPSHQNFRLDLLDRFAGRRVIQLPQSIFFADQAAVDACARSIERHGRFTLIVRDRPSLDFARRHFPCETLLAPDMAFAVGPLARPGARLPVLCLLRTDVEKARGQASGPPPGVAAVDWLEDDRRSLRLTAIGSRLLTLGERPEAARARVYERRAQARLRRGIATLSQGEVVITDRLHGHILSTLLDIPHVVLDNNYRKIGNFVEAWTARLAGLRIARDLAEAQRLAADLRFHPTAEQAA